MWEWCQTKETIKKDGEIIKKEPIEILELKSAITEMRNSLECSTTDVKWHMKEQSKLENRSTEIIQSNEQEEEEWRKMNWASETCGKSQSTPTYA